MQLLKRLTPFLLIALSLVLFFYFGGNEYLKWEKIQEVHKEGSLFVHHHPYIAATLFLALYIFVVISFIPGLIPLDLLAGFFFGPIFGIFLIVIGSTLGGSLIFLAARYAFGSYCLKKASGLFEKLQKGFERNQSSYLLFLRILPFFPFGLVSMASALLNVTFKKFFWTTALGMFPLAIIFTQAGTGLGEVFEAKGDISLSSLLNTNILIALSGLALMALLPILLRKKKPLY